jgi:VCBS repeat-containing protein
MKRPTLTAFLLAPTAWLVACGESPTHPAETDLAVEPSFSRETEQPSEGCAVIRSFIVERYSARGVIPLTYSEGEVISITAEPPTEATFFKFEKRFPGALESWTTGVPGTLTYTIPAEGIYEFGWGVPGATATFVHSCNTPPLAQDEVYPAEEDVVLNVPAPGVLANDTDADGDALTAVLVSGPSFGSLSLNADGSFTYTPDPNFHGVDDFTYKANDGVTDSNTATVTITVNSVNDVPVANDDAATTDEDVPVSIGVLANDVDDDPTTTLWLASVSDPGHGSVTWDAYGVVTYTPDPDFFGSDAFTYKATDNITESNVATVTITVNPVNDPPVANDDAAVTDEDVPVTIDVLANDTDVDVGTVLSVASVTSAGSGSALLNADNTITYTPNVDFSGNDQFDYVVSDGAGGSDLGTVLVTVNPGPDVVIKVKPGEDGNGSPINSKSKGLVPVAIMGTASFDVSTVDVNTLAFGPAGATTAHDPSGWDWADHFSDANLDGFTDLVTHYRQMDTGLQSGDTEACLTGMLMDGTPFSACGPVMVK